jgi:hypothetical protein
MSIIAGTLKVKTTRTSIQVLGEAEVQREPRPDFLELE